MLKGLFSQVRTLAMKLGFDRDWYLLFVAAVIGLVMSGVAMAFILPLRWVEVVAQEVTSAHLWWIVLVTPAVGALLAGIVLTVIPGPSGRGPGVSRIMYAVYRRRSELPWYIAVRKWIASTLTIASGGSAGAEGPIVTIGAVIGSNMARGLGISTKHTATLLGCGAAAGIASVFNAPIAGVFFVMEILLRDFSLRTLTPIVIASVISAAATQAVLGNDALFPTAELSIGAFTWQELPNYLVLGLLCGTAAALFVRGLYAAGTLFHRLPVPNVLRPMTGAILLGLIGVGYLTLYPVEAFESAPPQFYGNGYSVIGELLAPATYYADADQQVLHPAVLTLGLLLVLALTKALATCLTIGSGGAGGLFAPSLLIGAALGGAFGFVVNQLGWFPSASPAHYALVGMAAMVAAATHAPLTGILIVYEMTKNYEVILPLMLAAVIATIAGRVMSRDSVYSGALTAQGINVGAMSDLTILRRLTVNDVPLLAPVFVHSDDSAQRLLHLSERMAVSDFVVTDRSDRYVGMVTGGDLKEALVYREAIPLLQVSELQREDLPTVHSDDTLDVVLDRFARHDVHSLAVLSEHGDRRVLGLITRSRLMRRYQAALAAD